MNKCIWFNKKQEPCPWNSTDNSIFCKRHAVYEGIYSQVDIINGCLIFCSGCRNLFKPDEQKESEGKKQKQCDKCHHRKKTEIKNIINKSKCQAITSQNTPCTYSCLENDNYCAKHQTYKQWKELTDSGKNVCKNWIRGCFSVLTDNFKACDTCRKKEQTMENARNQKRTALAIEFNNKDSDNNKTMCVTCNTIYDNITITGTNNKCLQCYEKYIKSESRRNIPDQLNKKFSSIKKAAKDRNIQWELSDELAKTYIQSKCYYCCKLVAFNGIDRLDSCQSYIESNCVPCCKECNIMKQSFVVEDFLNIIQYVLSVNLIIEPPLITEHKSLFQYSNNASYGRFVTDITKRNITNEISEDKYNFIINQPF